MLPARHRPDYQAYAHAALNLVRENTRLYREGHYEAYRVVAVQLRLLLCDTNRVHNRLVDISVLPRLLPDLRLPALRDRRFDPQAADLSLASWLEQSVPLKDGSSIRLKEVIRGVCEQDGGAHVDSHPDSRLWQVEARAELIVAVGEDLLRELETWEYI